METKFYIYVLLDPDTEEVRYVGRTTNPAQREVHHRCAGRGTSPRDKWIKTLVKQKKKPLLVVIETCEGVYPAIASERKWIEHFRSIGANLTNSRNVNGTMKEYWENKASKKGRAS